MINHSRKVRIFLLFRKSATMVVSRLEAVVVEPAEKTCVLLAAVKKEAFFREASPQESNVEEDQEGFQLA